MRRHQPKSAARVLELSTDRVDRVPLSPSTKDHTRGAASNHRRAATDNILFLSNYAARSRGVSILVKLEYCPEISRYIDGKCPPAVPQPARHVEPEQIEQRQHAGSDGWVPSISLVAKQSERFTRSARM